MNKYGKRFDIEKVKYPPLVRQLTVDSLKGDKFKMYKQLYWDFKGLIEQENLLFKFN